MNRPQFLKSKFTVEHLSCFHVRPQSGPAVNILADVFWAQKRTFLTGCMPCSCSVTQSCLTLWDPMECSVPGFPVLHYPSEFVQTHVLWFGDANQPSRPLSSPSPPAFNLSQHQDLFQWVSSSHQVAKVLELQLQYQSFQWIFRVDFLGCIPKWKCEVTQCASV